MIKKGGGYEEDREDDEDNSSLLTHNSIVGTRHDCRDTTCRVPTVYFLGFSSCCRWFR